MSWGGDEQSMAICFFESKVRVGTEWTDAVWFEALEFCESEERMMMFCPKEEQFGFILIVGLCWGSSDVSTKTTLVVSFVAGCWRDLAMGEVGEKLAIVFSTLNFFTVASAFVLRILRNGGDFAILVTVLRLGVDTIKSAAEEDAAIMKGFECPGECSLIGLWLRLQTSFVLKRLFWLLSASCWLFFLLLKLLPSFW